jgi:plasmid stability protein
MATLYVENVPKDRYEALRRQAKKNHRSIAAEVLVLLEQHVPTEKDLEKRRDFYRFVERLHAKGRRSRKKFPSTEEMIREDRER